MEAKKIAKILRNEIEEQYGTITNFCTINGVSYMPFANKLAGIRRGNDFQYIPIEKIANILGYEFQIVKKEK